MRMMRMMRMKPAKRVSKPVAGVWWRLPVKRRVAAATRRHSPTSLSGRRHRAESPRCELSSVHSAHRNSVEPVGPIEPGVSTEQPGRVEKLVLSLVMS
jgi:hypothetical protein